MDAARIDKTFQSDVEHAIENRKSVGCSVICFIGSLESGDYRGVSNADIPVRGIAPRAVFLRLR